MSRAPCLVHRARIVSMNSCVAGTMFMLPATASTITQAMSSPYCLKASSSWVGLLYSRTIVCSVVPAGTPAEEGLPKVSMPEPALTSRLSLWPW